MDTAVYDDMVARNTARRKNVTPQVDDRIHAGINDTTDALALLTKKWIGRAKKKKQEYEKYTEYTAHLFDSINKLCANTHFKDTGQIFTGFSEKFAANQNLEDHKYKLASKVEAIS